MCWVDLKFTPVLPLDCARPNTGSRACLPRTGIILSLAALHIDPDDARAFILVLVVGPTNERPLLRRVGNNDVVA